MPQLLSTSAILGLTQQIVCFAHLKTPHLFERMRLRGLSGARDEFHLAAIVQNLKTLASRLWRPPSNTSVADLA